MLASDQWFLAVFHANPSHLFLVRHSWFYVSSFGKPINKRNKAIIILPLSFHACKNLSMSTVFFYYFILFKHVSFCYDDVGITDGKENSEMWYDGNVRVVQSAKRVLLNSYLLSFLQLFVICYLFYIYFLSVILSKLISHLFSI